MQSGHWKANKYPRRLKRARQNAGLTQAELANRLGTRQPTVSRIEAGQKPRDLLSTRVVAFIEHTERSHLEIQDDIVAAIGISPEFKAFLARIAAEL